VTYDCGGSSGVSNDKLLAVYGFVEQDNPNDRFTIYYVDDRDRKVVDLGRNGTILSKGTVENMTLLEEAVSRGRNQLSSSADYHTVDLDDMVDVSRAELASSWRTEKLLLMDEFLSKHTTG
jgi:hypothetical protein